jgi:predicted enzyme related to lactoylglutathione lyase
MDALYPRLLVRDFDTAVTFYTAVLRDLVGVEPVKVIPQASYANWDINGEAGLVLFSRTAIADVVDTADLPDGPPTKDTSMLVLRVDDVERATEIFTKHGAVLVAKPQDRPEWGPGLRTAHLRDPEGNLLELQSY